MKNKGLLFWNRRVFINSGRFVRPWSGYIEIRIPIQFNDHIQNITSDIIRDINKSVYHYLCKINWPIDNEDCCICRNVDWYHYHLLMVTTSEKTFQYYCKEAGYSLPGEGSTATL